MRIRTMTTALLAAATIAPAPALAATAPAVSGPADRITTGRPSFSWTSGPAGEVVTELRIGRSGDLDASGTPVTDSATVQLVDLGSATSTRVATPLHSGTWYWRAAWRTADGVAPAESGWTDATRFVVPTMLRQMRGTYVQDVHSTAFDTRGSFMSNARVARVTCSVHTGKQRIARRMRVVHPTTTKRTSFRCPRMFVPERLDGRRLALRVVVRGGGRSLLAVQRFRAT